MNGGHIGPWHKVGIPGDVLQRWRHASRTISGLPPPAKRARLEDPPDGGIMLDVPFRKRSRMAYRLKKRKRTHARGRRRNRRVTMQWPRFKLVKFKVVSAFSTTQAAPGSTAQYLIKANDLNDPHGAISQNLPLGVDQWAAMYKKYVVVKSTHYVKIHNVSSTGSVTYGLTLRQPGESSLLASNEAYLELPMTRSKLLSPDQDHSGLGISYSAKRYWRVRKFMDHDELHASFTTTPSSPSKSAYVSFWFGDTNATDQYTIEGYATSEYTCLLFEPVTPSRSTL